jgi:hypothetical protein
MLIRLVLILALVLHPAMLTGTARGVCTPSQGSHAVPGIPAEAASFPTCCAGMEVDADVSSCQCASHTGVTGGLGCCCTASPHNDQQRMPQREQPQAPGDTARVLALHLVCDIRVLRIIDAATTASCRCSTRTSAPHVAAVASERRALLCVWTT